jgi:protein tyrosine/serine phosphatase
VLHGSCRGLNFQIKFSDSFLTLSRPRSSKIDVSYLKGNYFYNMSVYRVSQRLYGAAVVMCLMAALGAYAGAASKRSGKLANVRINNFGQINENYFRGAQPGDQDYPDLAAIGVKTVIDLTDDGRANEAGLVQRAGMKFYRIPLTTSNRPSDAAVSQFLKLVNDPANQPVYVHCQGGRHRTGVMTAVYRMTQDGWTADRAYAEMKQYRFEGFPGHPALKQFVFDFYTNSKRVKLVPTN